MSTDIGEDTKTTWLVGGAIALLVAAATPVISTFGAAIFVAFPGDGFGRGGAGDYLNAAWDGTWPYTLVEMAIAAAALVFLAQARRSAPNLAWGTVGTKALTLLVPAILVIILIIYVINSIRFADGGIRITF